jgi:hypothetical protein
MGFKPIHHIWLRARRVIIDSESEQGFLTEDLDIIPVQPQTLGKKTQQLLCKPHYLFPIFFICFPVCGGRFGPVLNSFGPLWRNIMNKGINPIQDRVIRDVEEPAIAFKHMKTRPHRALFPFLFKRKIKEVL